MTHSDEAIAFGAIDAILLLAKKFDITKLFTQDMIKDFINRVGTDVRIISILELIECIELSLSEEILNTILESYLKPICNRLATYYGGTLRNDDTFCKSLMIISQKIINRNNTIIREHIIDSLSKIFISIPSYRRVNNSPRIPLKSFLSCLIQFMISVSDNETEKEFVKSQLLNMLRQGMTNQRSWATLILGELFKSDITVFKAIQNQLYSPNNSIRLSAISAMRKLELTEDNINAIKATYLKAMARKNKLQKFLSIAIEVVIGKGALGSSKAEQIQIAGSLLSMDKTLRLGNLLEYKTWPDIYEHKFEWAEMLIDTNWNLCEVDMKRIAEDLVKIASDPNKAVAFIADIIYKTEKVHEQLRCKITNHLYEDVRKGAVELLSSLNPKIEFASIEYEKLKNSLIKDAWRDANGAFEILESNNLLQDAIFTT